MNCPNCRAQLPDGAVECAACGVILAKWKAKTTAAAPVPAPPPAAAAGGGNGVKVIAAAVLLAACLAGAYWYRRPAPAGASGAGSAKVIRTFENKVFGSAARLDQVSGMFTTFDSGKGAAWTDGAARYALTEAALGDFVYRMGSLSNPDIRVSYRPGDRLRALVLVATVARDGTRPGECIETHLRRAGAGGDKLAPNSGTRFMFPVANGTTCFGDPDTSYPNQYFVFVLPENEKEFTFLTGSDPAQFKLKAGWSALTVER